MEGVVAKRTLKKSYYNNKQITNEFNDRKSKEKNFNCFSKIRERIIFKMSIQILTTLALISFILLIKYLNINVVKQSDISKKIIREYRKNYTLNEIKEGATNIYKKAYLIAKPIIPEKLINKVKELKKYKTLKDNNINNERDNEVKIYEEISNSKDNTENQSVGISVDEENVIVVVSSSLSSEGTIAEKIKKEGISFVKPLSGVITSRFGAREVIFEGIDSYHTGIDIANTLGKEVVSSIDGTVTVATYNKYNGNYVEVKNGKVVTKYCHLSKISVKNGAKIKSGQKLGEVGSTGLSTGPHLHFEIVYNETKINPELILNF